MNKNINCVTDSAPNLSVDEKSLNTSSSRETTVEKEKSRDLLNRNLNKSIAKLCSEADMRIKVLLSNTVTGASSSSSKLSSLTFDSTTKRSSRSTLPPLSKMSSTNTSRQSTLKTTSKYKSSRDDISGSHHFNTEIDVTDDPTIKQLTVIKILRLQNLARKMEERQNAVIKNNFKSNVYQKSYASGLEEGFRYGYFVNPTEGFNTQSETTRITDDSTYDDFDKVIYKNSELQMIEKKESERMRGGYHDPQQKGIKKYEPDNNSLANKSESTIELSKSLTEMKPSKLTIIHEYPNKCTENINVSGFNEKFQNENEENKKSKLAKIEILAKDLNEADRGGQYLQYFEKMLNSVGEEFAKGFRAGFGDGFVAGNIFIAVDSTFTADEKEYISQMRKILKFSDDDLQIDIKKLNARADQMKRNLNITSDEFEDISYLIGKGLIKKKSLQFSKNDYKYYTYVNKRDKKNTKVKSVYEDDSDVIFSISEPEREYIPQHTKNRAIRYLTKHRINEFFQFLGSHLVATKPDDPISFLINILDKCIEYRFNEFVVQAPLLFTKKHVESVYFVLDPMVTGYIDLCQYEHGMEALGLRDSDDVSHFRPGEKIDKYVFISNAYRRLLSKFREMIAMDSITGIPSKATSVEAN